MGGGVYQGNVVGRCYVKRVLGALVVLLLGWFLGTSMCAAMATEEQRIRWLFEAEARSFNGASLFTVLDGFAADYRDRTLGLQRSALRGALLQAFRSRRDPATGAFRYRVELPDESFVAEVDAGGGRGTVETELLLFDSLAADEGPLWHLRLLVEVEKRAMGWRIVESEHQTLSGARPR